MRLLGLVERRQLCKQLLGAKLYARRYINEAPTILYIKTGTGRKINDRNLWKPGRCFVMLICTKPDRLSCNIAFRAQIALGEKNSGALTGNMLHDNAAPKAAANGPQEWNTMQVKVVSDRVTVVLNGVTTAENVILENACNWEIPAYAEGQILLIAGNAPLSVREMYIRELPATPRFELSEEEAADGFEVLFDGTSMHKWTGNTTNYVPVDGTIYVTAQYGGSGNLYTKKEYGDFVQRFEFAFDREGVNNGIGIRTPMSVDAAYHGMEIQMLAHDCRY